MNLQIEEAYLKALSDRACKNPMKPYVGFREICELTGTSTRTFHTYQKNFLEKAFIKKVQVGKYNKCVITEKGQKRLKQLIDRRAHKSSFIEICEASRQDLLSFDCMDGDKIGHSTVTGTTGFWSPNEEDKIKKRIIALIKDFRDENPNKKCHIEISIF